MHDHDSFDATSPSDAPKTPAYDLERRRRFLKLAIGTAGAFGLAGSRLAHALPLQDDPITGGGTCTTTETYFKSRTATQSYPSGDSYSFSGTEECYEAGTSSNTRAYSYSHINTFYGVENGVSTYTGHATYVWPKSGTMTESESCVGTDGSYTYSYPSFPAFTKSSTLTESGSRTVTCSSSGSGGAPEVPSFDLPDGPIPEAPTFDSKLEILESSTRRRQELMMKGLVDELRALEKKVWPLFDAD